jgi:hypothetical protein
MSGQDQTATQAVAEPKVVGEWFWRFLAVAMLFAVGWVVWISYQLNPPPLVTSAAYVAAAKARAGPSAAGAIAPKPEAQAGTAQAEAAKQEAPKPAGQTAEASAAQPEAAPKPEEAARQPPVNVERLKLSDTITVPEAAAPKKK